MSNNQSEISENLDEKLAIRTGSAVKVCLGLMVACEVL